MGLFDTVNSVPRFETAWMQRSKFPYTARSSAKIIRHAVSIDERRAKFRQDLIGEAKPGEEKDDHPHTDDGHPSGIDEKFHPDECLSRPSSGASPSSEPPVNGVHAPAVDVGQDDSRKTPATNPAEHVAAPPAQSGGLTNSTESLAAPVLSPSTEHLLGASEGASRNKARRFRRRWSETRRSQDVQEVWFAGGHADIGGGWTKTAGETWMLSHAPLVWMVHEAERAGLPLDPM